jgi:predicted phospho-2-dehydro-3-deoxyheptonate aldolase
MDHGTTLGAIQGLHDTVGTITGIVEGGADAMVLHKGVLGLVNRHPHLARGHYLLHLHVSTILGPDPNYKVQVSTVEEAVRLGADGISVHVNIGTETETEMIRDLGEVAADCEVWGMPLLAMMYSKKESKDPVQIAHAARLGQELGADIVKVDYPGTIDGAHKISSGVQVPVVIAGGSKLDQPGDLLRTINDALSAGCAGVSIGRNIFQHDNPKLITRIVKNLVHNVWPLEECLDRLSAGRID